MKTLKKLFSVSAIVALLGTLAPMYAFGAGNSLDLDPEFPAAYAYAYANGITTQSEANVDMGGKLTRIAMAKMIAKYAINVLKLTPDTSKACTFADVTAALDTQYDNGVTLACQLGLMGQNMPENKFRPNDLVTRAEFGTTLSRAMNANSDDLATMNAANPYYKDHLNFLNAEGIMTKIDNPSMQEVRGYVMLMMMRADENYTAVEGCSAEELLACFNADDYDACIAACSDESEDPEEPQGDGFVTVKRVGSTATQEVARNAVNKKVGSIKLTAGEYDTVVNSIVVAHSGLGTAKDVKVQLYMNGVSVSSSKSITKSSQEATLKVSPALTIKAGKSETIDIMATLGDGAGSNETHSFTVSAVNVLNGKAEGTPIALDSIRTTSYEVSTGKVSLSQGVTSLEAGDTNKKLISVRFTPKNNTKLNSFIVTKAENDELNLDEVFANVKAMYDNKEVGKVTVSNDTIAISDLNIETNKAITIELKGDSYYVGKSGTVNLNIDADTEAPHLTNDVVAVEVSTNENMRIYNETTGALAIVVDGVDMTLKNLTTKAQNVAAGKSDVELMNLELSTANEFELSQFTVTADSLTGLEEVYVYVDGSEYDELTSTGQLFKDDTFTVTAKRPLNIKVVGDLKDDATGSYKFAVTINQIKNDNGDKITVSNVSKQGHTTTIKAAGVTAKKTASMPSNKTIKEGEEATLLYFDLKANNDEVTVASLDIAFGTSVNVLSGYTDELVLMQGNREIDTIDLTKLTGDLTTGAFENVNYTISEDETVSFTVKANIKGGEIANIGKKVQLTLNSYNTVAGTEYTIASELPEVVLSDREDEFTTITVNNTSSYDDIEVSSITLKVSTIIENLPKNMESFAATARFVDAKNGNVISGTISNSGTVPGTITFTPDTALNNGDYLILELENTQGVQANWYKVNVSSLTFLYMDDTDGDGNYATAEKTPAITETYDVTL